MSEGDIDMNVELPESGDFSGFYISSSIICIFVLISIAVLIYFMTATTQATATTKATDTTDTTDTIEDIDTTESTATTTFSLMSSNQNPCANFVPGSVTEDCVRKIYKDAGCTVLHNKQEDLDRGLKWANDNKYTKEYLEWDAKNWATLTEDVRVIGCYGKREPNKKYFMYGPGIGDDKVYLPVTKIDKIGEDKIYMLQDGIHTKMILWPKDKPMSKTKDHGTAKYYTGSLTSWDFTNNINTGFDPTKWSTYTENDANYKLRECPVTCPNGCDLVDQCVDFRV